MVNEEISEFIVNNGKVRLRIIQREQETSSRNFINDDELNGFSLSVRQLQRDKESTFMPMRCYANQRG